MKYNGRFLGPCQKGVVVRVVQNDPNCTGTSVMRNIANIPDELIHIDHSLKDFVDRLVRAQRDVVLSRNLGGVRVGGNKHDKVYRLRKYCEDRHFDIAIKRHNSNVEEDHINVNHEYAVVSGNSLQNDDGQ